ncbi:Conserved protein of unknown function [Blastococcus saxobsidens DD2]|uniref:Uncharacterized protein n=1 Tax=Blastococcus saxobsidens (strain DD2) TaxID=1146883 RepID=H6RT50_BLASD|nr:Conserved protein of unknown function [Blastococcus saxobsidens DD2]
MCPECGKEDSVPVVYGMPVGDDFEQAERGVVALGGCVMMPGETADFVCRSCGLEWGSASDPTADEAELAGLLDVEYVDLVCALGTGWRREPMSRGEGMAQWFVSGEPAQLAVGVLGPWFVLDRPLTGWGRRHPDPLTGEEPRFSRDDLLHQPHLVAEMAEAIASGRRRSFRWCRTCRRPTAPEAFVASKSSCAQCVAAFGDAYE